MTLMQRIEQAIFRAILDAMAEHIMATDPNAIPEWMQQAIDAKAAEIAAGAVV